MRIRLSILLIICIISSFLPVSTLFAEVQGEWSVSRIGGDIYGLGLASDSGKLVMSGRNGAIGTSADGVNWEKMNSTVNEDLYGIIKGDNKLIAVGVGGTIVISEDSKKWEKVSSQTDNIIYSVIWAGNKYVAVGDKGTVLTSPDGREWKKQVSVTEVTLYCITYGNGLYVATGDNGTIITSVDGADWLDKSVSEEASLDSIVYGNGIFVAYYSYINHYYISSDGSTWVKKEFPADEYIDKILWDGSKFVGVGYLTSAISKNGIDWTFSPDYRIRNSISAVVNNGGRYYAVSNQGTVSCSKDGVNWELILLGNDSLGIYSCVFGNGKYVAINRSMVLVSEDGLKWGIKDLGLKGEECLFEIVWGNGCFVVVGTEGIIYTSRDGLNWEKRKSGTTLDLLGITYKNGRYVAAGIRGIRLTSSDAVNWNISESIYPIDTIMDVEWLNGAFWAVGSGGIIICSKDGVKWNIVLKSSGLERDNLYATTYGRGRYIASGEGKLKTSNNGIKWEYMNVDDIMIEDYIPDTTYSEGYFYLAARDKVYKSGDGITWNIDLEYTGLSGRFVNGPDKLLMLGYNGTIASKPIENPVKKLMETYGNCLIMKTGSPKTILNGKEAFVDSKNTSVAPLVRNGRTLVPLRFISESFGASVDWDAAASTATIKAAGKTAVLTLGKQEMTIDGGTVKLDTPAQMINGKTFIPLRALCENVVGKKLFYGSGLIVIGDSEKIPFIVKDPPLIDGLMGLY